ncbi:VCBS repeat-containing protein [Ruficoccus amylovorans]|uniref:VCBS repeat-containing protein n=1 Tax=Ruficoccus amylovorans TaxID=1804625 RepID=A0A842HAU6_9BACT|nr:VCBS repeat-containing protein [Ruficoccus amylovorans]MBC2592757.1 VCBS repeat-containing protein [Ruficoccus amylovorans]
MRGYFSWALIAALWLFVVAGAVHAGDTWQWSSSGNTSLNFSYSGFGDPFLDYTSPLVFTVKLQDAQGSAIDNTSGSCWLNFSSPTAQTIFLNYSAGAYRTNLTYGSVSSGNTFTLHCQNGSVIHTFSNTNGTVVFQYDVYEPVLVDVYTSSEAGQEALPLISGQYTTFYILALNITGSTEPISITDVDCNLSVDGAASVSATQVSGDYLVAEHLLASTGDVRLEGMCQVGGGTYISEPRNVSVQPLFVPSGIDLGEVDVYQQPILLLTNGSDSFLAHLSYEGGLYARMQVSRLYPSFATILDLNNEALKGQLALADIYNDGALTMLYAGPQAFSNELFSSTLTNFASESPVEGMGDFLRPSMSVFDSNGDGLTDVLFSGSRANIETTILLTNNGSNLTLSNVSLPALLDSSLCYGDFDGDSRYDLFVSGKNASGILSGVYFYNGSDYELSQSLPVQLYKGSCALGRFLDENTTSLIHFGTSSATSPDTSSNWDYVIYTDTREWSMAPIGLLPGFNGTIRGDAVVADFSGDGLSDIVLCGGTSGNAVLSLYINDLKQSGGFVAVDPFNDSYALPECSLSAADYDFDGDLDLAYTGVGSDAPVLLFNNTASEISPNTNPLPPTELTGAWNLTTGALWINWSAGSDAETPSGMLSYNLEVESVHGELLLSGQPTVGSHPVQGYLGNMQYRQNTTLDNQTPGNVHVRVQSVDTGLAQSAWMEITVSLDACSPTQEWNVSVAGGCVMPASVQPNSHIIIQNGSSLTLSSATVLGENTTIEVENGTLDVAGYPLSSINATIRLGAFGDISSSRVNLSGVTLDFGRNYTLSDSSLDAIVVGKNVTLINTSWNSLDVDGELDVRYYLELNASNQFGKALDSVEVYTAEGFLTSGSRLNLTAWLINATGSRSVSHNLSFFLSGYYAANGSYVLTGSSRANLTLYLKPEPETGELSLSTVSGVAGDNYSSDLLAYSQAENVTLEKVGVGAIRFLESVNLSFLNLSKVVAIGPNVIRVNVSEAPGLNRSAQLRFFNLTFLTEPLLLRNGVPCEQCDTISYASGVLNATVPGFSEYSLVDNSELSLLTPSVLFNGTASTFAVSYHAYGNDSDNIEEANCSVTVENSTLSMLAGQSNHSVNLLLNGTGNVSAEVYCSGNSTYEPLNVSFALTVVRSGAYFLKDSAYTGLVHTSVVFGNLSATNRFWAMGAVDRLKTAFAEVSVPAGFSLGQTLEDGDAILADLNHDGWGDLVVMGSGTLAWYDNQTTRKPLNLSLSDGDFALLDLDADGDQDIIACGLNASNEAQTLVLENQLADEDYQRGVSFIPVSHSIPDFSACSIRVGSENQTLKILIAGRWRDLLESYHCV